MTNARIACRVIPMSDTIPLPLTFILPEMAHPLYADGAYRGVWAEGAGVVDIQTRNSVDGEWSFRGSAPVLVSDGNRWFDGSEGHRTYAEAMTAFTGFVANRNRDIRVSGWVRA